MKPVKLGRKYDSPCCVSSGDAKPAEVCFPSVYLENVKIKLPNSGLITFRYKTSRITEDVKRDKIQADLELLEIVDVKGDESAETPPSPKDALDAIADEVTGKKKVADESDNSDEYLADEDDGDDE